MYGLETQHTIVTVRLFKQSFKTTHKTVMIHGRSISELRVSFSFTRQFVHCHQNVLQPPPRSDDACEVQRKHGREQGIGAPVMWIITLVGQFQDPYPVVCFHFQHPQQDYFSLAQSFHCILGRSLRLSSPSHVLFIVSVSFTASPFPIHSLFLFFKVLKPFFTLFAFFFWHAFWLHKFTVIPDFHALCASLRLRGHLILVGPSIS